MEDISSTGFSITVTASETFPSGITLTKFADDKDPMELPEVVIAEAAMNANGDLVVWTSPKPLLPKLSLIAGSDDDVNMQLLAEANRAGKGKRVARDIITMVGNYPDGSTITFDQGKVLSYTPGKAPTQAGRYVSNSYGFAFQNIASTRARA